MSGHVNHSSVYRGVRSVWHGVDMLFASIFLCYVNPLTSTVAIWVQLFIKHPVLDQVKPLFVIFDIRAL